MNTIYIHYGHSEYHPEFIDINTKGRYTVSCKPQNGLWASRKDAKYGWIDWCRDQALNDDEEFGFGNFDTSFEFQLMHSANILEIHCEDDILPYVIRKSNIYGRYKTSSCDGIDFDKIRSEGYDGLELFLSDDYSMHNGIFNMWDCDSIVVWNSDMIKIKED